jgi:hypothetical protein
MEQKLQSLFDKLHYSDNRREVADEIINYIKTTQSDYERKNIVRQLRSNQDIHTKAEIRGYLDIIDYIFSQLER